MERDPAACIINLRPLPFPRSPPNADGRQVERSRPRRRRSVAAHRDAAEEGRPQAPRRRAPGRPCRRRRAPPSHITSLHPGKRCPLPPTPPLSHTTALHQARPWSWAGGMKFTLDKGRGREGSAKLFGRCVGSFGASPPRGMLFTPIAYCISLRAARHVC